MKKTLILFISLISFNLYSSECGEIKLKGTLKKNPQTKALEFNVLETTNSKRTYFFVTKEVANEVALFVGKQLNLTVKIIKPLDGTHGEINEVVFIDVNFDSMLALNKNAITVLNSQACQR